MSKFKKQFKSDILNDLDTPNVLESVKSNPEFGKVTYDTPRSKSFNFARLRGVLTVCVSVAVIAIAAILILPKLSLSNGAMEDAKYANPMDNSDGETNKSANRMPSESEPSYKENSSSESYSGSSIDNEFLDESAISDFESIYYSKSVTDTLTSNELNNLYSEVKTHVENNMTLDQIINELGETHKESIQIIYDYLTK